MQGLTEEQLLVKWAPCLIILIIVIIKFIIRIEERFLSISIIRLSAAHSCLARAERSLITALRVILATNKVIFLLKETWK